MRPPVITIRSPLWISLMCEGFPFDQRRHYPACSAIYERFFRRYRSSKTMHPFTVGMPDLFPHAQRRALRLQIFSWDEEAGRELFIIEWEAKQNTSVLKINRGSDSRAHGIAVHSNNTGYSPAIRIKCRRRVVCFNLHD